MSDPFSNLIDFSSLSKLLSKHQSQLSRQESLHEELQSFKSESSSKQQIQEKSIQDLQQQSKSFTSGLLKISKIEEKLASWSDRFRSLEESQFDLKAKLKLLEDHYEKQLEQQRLSQVKQLAAAELNFIKTIEDMSSRQALELSINCGKIMEKVESVKERLYECESREIRDRKEDGASGSRVYQKSRSLVDLVARVESIEHILAEFDGEKTSKGELRSPRDSLLVKEVADRKQAEILELVRQEIENKLESLDLHPLPSPKSSDHLDDPEPAPAASPSTLQPTVRKAKRVTTHTMTSDLVGIEKKILSLDEKLMEMQKRHSMIQPAISDSSYLKPGPKPIPEPPKSSLIPPITLIPSKSPNESNSSSEEDQPLSARLADLSKDFEKFKKNLPLIMYKSELEDILSQFSKRIKDTRKPNPEFEDFNPKIQEHEQRLNSLWKSYNGVVDKVSSVESKVLKLSESFNMMSEVVKAESESRMDAAEKRFNSVAEEVKLAFEKGLKSMKDFPAMQNEQYFRSMILTLRNEVAGLREEADNKRNRLSTPIPIDSPIELEEIQEPLQLGMLQSILKQHETAIRLLANKTFPTRTEERTASTETFDYLTHLEDLKKEMKEILSKQEDRKTLSSKDLEIIQSILSSLETKIGKEELGQMAEKNDLHKIYRMLKRRIDELAQAVMRKNEQSVKDEACFLKRKHNMECASCGQMVAEKVEGKLVYESWNKFPSKSANNATGFSRILNSLVQSPSGGHMLPREGRSASTLEMASPNQMSVKSKTRKVSTRMGSTKPKN